MSREKQIETEIKLALLRFKAELSKTSDPGSLEDIILPDVIKDLLHEFPPKTFLAQQDHYFDHPKISLAKNDLVLRRRQNMVFLRKRKGWILQKHEQFLTYKGKAQRESFTKSRKEIEVLAQEEVFSILEELGFQKILEVKKHRWVSMANNNIHLSLDVVEKLGIFLEVELVTPENKQKLAFDEITKFLQTWKLDQFEKERKSYAELLRKTI